MADIDISSDRKFKATPEWMAEKYAMLNDWLFGSQLGACRFEVFTSGRGSMGKVLGWFSISAEDLKCDRRTRRIYAVLPYIGKRLVTRDNFVEMCRPVIKMNGNYSGTEYSLLSTLVHEMCHYATEMDGIFPARHHGSQFMRWAHVVSERSGGIFSVDRVANAEEMKGYELDSRIAGINQKKLDNKKAKLIAAFVFRTDGKTELTLTSHQDVLDRLYLRNTDPEMGASRYGTVSKIAYSRDPNLIDRLWENGYKSNSKTYNYYNLDPMDVFGKYDFIGDYRHAVIFSEDGLNESLIREQSFDDMFEDIYCDYDEEALLWEFLADKKHGVKTKKWDLIPAQQYGTLLQRYMSAPTPEAARIPSSVVYGWFRTVTRNTLAIEHITAFAGHSQWFPTDACEDVFDEDGDWSDFEYACNYLENIGFYDWCKLPDGSDAWSDFGLEPIFKLLRTYDSSDDPSETLLLINRILDITHCRGDLASAFIEGGSRTCSQISGILREGSGDERGLELLKKIERRDEKPENVGYHGGDLGKSEYFASYATCNRGTGHFGTGTYFVGDEKQLDTGSYKDRPRHKVDFSPYNLVKITDFRTGLAFHDALRDINNKFFHQFVNHDGGLDADGLLNQCKVIAVFLFKDIDGFDDLWDKARIVYNKVMELYEEYLPEYRNVVNYGRSDRRTISTELISSFGYDGVDCRSCPGMDNTMFGSVIYDLKDDANTLMERKNDKGKNVPEKCTKCGGKVAVQIKGEPVFVCSKCGKYYGTLPFPDNLDEVVSRAIRSVIRESNEKQKAIRRIYKTTQPVTSRIYKDDHWQGVSDICSAIEGAGFDVEVTVRNGGYRNSLGGDTLHAGGHDVSYWKEYLLTVTSPEGVSVDGTLNCHAAGSVDDPFDRYDMSLVLY